MGVHKEHLNVYALYKGDTFLDLGTKRELAERRNVSMNTLNFWTSKVNKRRIKTRKYQNALILIKIGTTDDDLK